MNVKLEWDETVNIICTTYNFFPNGQSHDSAFFLMFGRDVFIPASANLLQPKL